ncbi:cardiolipin synthase [Lacticaseibacillus pabuli]|uniref:Cardiolipin synthase n=1 Tax=Lacticaseibacillus pabuli TaxID=3025672 RepID=A0ABY7WRS6_9LACO|nr:cardiolipin synthase [Lacticaseibacillus sp. KACC 23028]WDF81681.1 cardiolipin synthase [Lacticaseibacillus sp. KACC 23028]
MVQWIVMGVLILNAVFAIWTVFRSERDIASSWAWLLVLLIPILGAIAYYFVGRRMLSNRLMVRVDDQDDAVLQARRHRQNHTLATDLAGRLQRLVLGADGAVVTNDNDLTLITQYDEWVHALLSDVARAQHSILIEAYEIEADSTGLALLPLLTEKAQAGVQVDVMLDGFGSRRLPRHFWRPLKDAGGRVEHFGGSNHGRLNLRVNFRNHRKIVVIDGQTAYTGGFNIGKHERRVQLGSDIHLRVQGGAAIELLRVLVNDWNRTTRGAALSLNALRATPGLIQRGVPVQVISSEPSKQLSVLALTQQRLIGGSTDRLYIETPYFIPDASVMDALALAISRDVDVRIMVPETSDKRVLTNASMFYLQQVVELGGRVFTYKTNFRRNKLVLADWVSATGSGNLDPRSSELNFEIAVLMYDHQIADQLADDFISAQSQATELRVDFFQQVRGKKRLRWELSRLLAPIL